jgi:hypothetical protein
MGLIGPAAMSELTAFLADESASTLARDAAAAGVKEIALRHPDFRPACVAILTTALERFHRNPQDLNALLITHLMDLEAKESALKIKAAFDAGEVDASICGTWGEVRKELGVVDAPQRQAPARPPPQRARPTAQNKANPIVATFEDEEDQDVLSGVAPFDWGKEKNPAAQPVAPIQPNQSIAPARAEHVRPKLTPREKERLKERRKQQRQARKNNRRR